MQVRECGECRLCCSLLGIPELRKLPGEPCAKENPEPGCAGCTIYQSPERPKVCGEYQCAWKRGLGSATKDRPDMIGVVFDPQNDRRGRQKIVILEPSEGFVSRLVSTGDPRAGRIAELVGICHGRYPVFITGPSELRHGIAREIGK